MRRLIFAINWLLFAVIISLSAQSAGDPFVPPAGSSGAAFYERNAAAIDQLREQVARGPTENRLKAFEALATLYLDGALSLATGLVSDGDESVAYAAARLLADSVVMTDHDMDGREIGRFEERLMERVEAARATLRKALDHPHTKVYRLAASALATLSDEPALVRIENAARVGRISGVEAVNYFGLAEPSVGARFIEPYLRGSSVEAQRAAISYLGANSKHQSAIRDNVFLNTEADIGSRIIATRMLSRFDREFLDYALIVTSNPKTPSELFGPIVSSVIDLREVSNSLTPSVARAFQEAISQVGDLNPDIDLRPLQQRLEHYF